MWGVKHYTFRFPWILNKGGDGMIGYYFAKIVCDDTEMCFTGYSRLSKGQLHYQFMQMFDLCELDDITIIPCGKIRPMAKIVSRETL